MNVRPERLALQPVLISAPFGNYIQPRGTTPTVGTFTALRRGGRSAAFGRALLTVRYYRRLGAWVNRIGLRNPGIDSVSTTSTTGRPLTQCVLSVHGFDDADWRLLLARVSVLRPLAVELNISCPNVGELSWPRNLFADACATGVPVILKVPPVRYREMATVAADQGVTWFHATNTLPVPKGGMSGVPLKPLSLGVVAWLRAEFGTRAGIIGGGGIRSATDVHDYAAAGADRFAVGTFAMRPSALRRSADWLSEIQDAARAVVSEMHGGTTYRAGELRR